MSSIVLVRAGYHWRSYKRQLYRLLAPLGLRAIQKALLRLALGKRTYHYMCRTIQADPRLRNCRMADIVVRKDGTEKRFEADWLKNLYCIVHDVQTPPL